MILKLKFNEKINYDLITKTYFYQKIFNNFKNKKLEKQKFVKFFISSKNFFSL